MANDCRVAALLDTLEPELLGLAIEQDLPKYLIQDIWLTEKLWDSMSHPGLKLWGIGF